MNDNNYVLLPQVKIGFIYNNIQTVVPFVIDESLDVYNLLRKLVDYCNELGARSNELQYILKDLVDFLNNKLNEQKDYINNFLENLHQEWLDYKQSLEDKYNAFTEQVDELFETYKAQIRDEYNQELANIRTNNETLYNNLKTLLDDKITELTNYANSIETNIDNYIDEKDQAIKELITNFQNEFTEYQKTVNNELIELGDTLTELINTNEQNVIDEINTKTQEIVTSLGNVNMQQLVTDKLNSYDSEELSDLFTNLYGTLIRITYMNTDAPPTLTGTTPIYHYNPTTNVLTDCTTGTTVPLNENSIYMFEDRLFIVSNDSTIQINDTGKIIPYSMDKLGINGEMYFYRTNNDSLEIYDNDFNITKTISLPNLPIYIDSVKSRYIIWNSTKFSIYNDTGLMVEIETSDYIPNETYTYNGYGIGIIDENNYVIFNYIRPNMMEPTIPNFEELMQLISYTYITLNGSTIVKGEQNYLQVNDYMSIYNLISSGNYLLAFKMDTNNYGILFNDGYPLYPITFNTNNIYIDGRSINIYSNAIYSLSKMENGLFINDQSPLFKGKLFMSNGNYYLTSDYYGDKISNEYTSTMYAYMGRYFGFSSTSSSYNVEKVPYYDLDLHQLIYLPNPYQNEDKTFDLISNKYCRLYNSSTRNYTLGEITYSSGVLTEIPYQRSGS